MAHNILCKQPEMRRLKKYSSDISCAHYIKPCKIIRCEFKNLRVRREEKIDRLMEESVYITGHLGSITAQTLHQVFGIGVALARSQMQKMLVRGLIEQGSHSSGVDIQNYNGFTFPMEETNRHKPSDYDEPHVLTSEGERLLAKKKYEPIKLSDETLYFVEPGALMLPRGVSINTNGKKKWKKENNDEDWIKDIKMWFEGDIREIRNIPDGVYGVSLEEEELMDDFLQPKEKYPPTKVKVSFIQPTEESVWFIQFHDRNVLEPSKSRVNGVGIWYDNRLHQCDDKLKLKLPAGKVGYRWKISIQRHEDIKVKKCLIKNKRFIFEADTDRPPGEWISLDKPLDVTLEISDPDDKNGKLRVFGNPIPAIYHMDKWARYAMEKIQLPLDRPITEDILLKELKKLSTHLLETWIHNDNDERATEIIRSTLTKDSYIENEKEKGNWLIKYRLEEKEVFNDAL